MSGAQWAAPHQTTKSLRSLQPLFAKQVAAMQTSATLIFLGVGGCYFTDI